jgi:hypothetical protein
MFVAVDRGTIRARYEFRVKDGLQAINVSHPRREHVPPGVGRSR